VSRVLNVNFLHNNYYIGIVPVQIQHRNMVDYIVMVQVYNWLIVQLILHVLDLILGQVGLHGVDVVLLVVMVRVRAIEIVQVHQLVDLVLLLVMDRVLM
jgi:hypothetical protein